MPKPGDFAPYDPGSADEHFEKTLEQWSSRLFTDSPQGRTLFAAGAGWALMRLHDKFTKAEWDKLYRDLEAFTAAYMAESAD